MKHTTKKRPTLSVIIPAYNERHTILAVLKSVRSSGVPSVETIVVDDGSTDNSYKVLALVLYFASSGYTGVEEGTRFFRANSSAVLREAVRRYNRLSDSRITRVTPLQLQPMTSCSIHDGSLQTAQDCANEAWFRENFANDLNIAFHPNRIAGFIKTHSSFHAVDMRESTFAGPRRSILINLNLKHSLAARAWQSFRTRVLRLSS